MYGKTKHTIRKHIEWAKCRNINKDHSVYVCKVVARRKVKNKGKEWQPGVTLVASLLNTHPPPLRPMVVHTPPPPYML